jgi:hypothetical protein
MKRLRYQKVISLETQVGVTSYMCKWANTDPRTCRRWDQVPRRSKHPLPTDHTRCGAQFHDHECKVICCLSKSVCQVRSNYWYYLVGITIYYMYLVKWDLIYFRPVKAGRFIYTPFCLTLWYWNYSGCKQSTGETTMFLMPGWVYPGVCVYLVLWIRFLVGFMTL